MSTTIATILWAAVLAAAPPAPATAADAPEICDSLTLAHARELVLELNGVIEKVARTDEGGFVIAARFPGDLPVVWTGMACTGEGEATACTEYEIEVPLKPGPKAKAERLSRELNYLYLNDGVVDGKLVFWRMGFTYGGVTRAHMKSTLKVTMDVAWSALADVFPKGEGK